MMLLIHTIQGSVFQCDLCEDFNDHVLTSEDGGVAFCVHVSEHAPNHVIECSEFESLVDSVRTDLEKGKKNHSFVGIRIKSNSIQCNLQSSIVF